MAYGLEFWKDWPRQMKSFMIFLNFVTSVVVGLLVFVHFIHRAPEAEPVLSQTPDSPTNTVEPPIQSKPPFTIPPLDNLISKNLFHPDRGKIPEDSADNGQPPVNSSNFELMGTFTVGNKVGAIIRELQAPKKPGVETPAPSTKKVFLLDETMPNGCKLKKVDPKSVVIEQNGNEFTLELDLADSSSRERQDKAQKAGPIKAIPTVLNAPAQSHVAQVQPPGAAGQAQQQGGSTAPVTPAAVNQPGQPAAAVPVPPSQPKGRMGRRVSATPDK